LTREGRIAGAVQFGFRKPYEWLPREVDLLTAAAERCSLAAAKARLVEELAAREEQVRQLAGHMLRIEERERKRISSELHDEAGQSLICIRLQLELLERMAAPAEQAQLKAGLEETRALTERTIIEIRRLIGDLSPAVLEQLGLPAALRLLAARLRNLHGMRVKLRIAFPGALSKDLSRVAYRLTQECVNNIARHSGASHVNISLSSADGKLKLHVEDDGAGFNVEEALGKRDSFGLAGMRERAALFGGVFHLRSRPGRGTRVLIELPVPEGGQ
jgi:signal transduction histidine kinase